MIDQRDPTHRLVIEVPLHLGEAEIFDYDPVHTALATVLSISRLAVDKVLCGDVNVEIRSVTPEATDAR